MANIKCDKIDLRVPNKCLLENTDLIISEGSKYALIGPNGTGKTTLVKHIATKAWLSIPPDLDVYYVEQEVEADPMTTVFQKVLDSNTNRKKLIQKYNELKNKVEQSDHPSKKDFDDYEKTTEEMRIMNVDKDESIVRYLLFGLGFNTANQDRVTSEFSGGWRMRIALAQALYLKPKLLLLDEPTNHIDLEGVIWLTNYLSKWKNTLIIISHDKNFINEVCDNVIHLHEKKLNYYKGNYDNFLKALGENERHAEKEWNKFDKKIAEMKKKGTKKEIIQGLLKDNKYMQPQKPYRVKMAFSNTNSLNFKEDGIPVIEIRNLTFGYSQESLLFDDISLDISMGDRVAIVGKNGVGKTTFIRTILGQIQPDAGHINIDRRIKIGYYHQHASEALPQDKTPVEYLLGIDGQIGVQSARAFLGCIGLESHLHNAEIKTLSGGQKSRVVFCKLFVEKPHVIFLDEPTNHLDIECIDALIEAINNFEGAVIMISHNVDLIEKTKAHLWELENKEIVELTYDDYYEKVIDEINALLQ